MLKKDQLRNIYKKHYFLFGAIWLIVGFLLIAYGLSLVEVIISSFHLMPDVDTVLNTYFGSGLLINFLAIVCLFSGGMILKNMAKHIQNIDKN